MPGRPVAARSGPVGAPTPAPGWVRFDGVDLPVNPPIEPMLATSVKEMPTGPGMSYEPKWDGYRCIIFRDGDEVELASRGGKTLTRYFPEVVEQARAQLPVRCAVDGELVVIRPDPAGPRLDFDVLSQRIHPAASRVAMLAASTPASFVAFDLLALGDEALLERPYAGRAELLRTALAAVRPPVYLTPTTTDVAVARRWFEVFEGAGLDGVIAKPADIGYVPGKRLMFKVKHARTADVVVAGFRWHTSGPVVGSLLLGLYDDAGTLHHVGVCASFTAARRRELVDEIAPLRANALAEHPWVQAWGLAGAATAADTPGGHRVPGAQSRWTGKKDLSWEPLRPEWVIEVGYAGMEGDRIRHTAQFKRSRPDRDPRSCTYGQLEQPVRYDVEAILRP